jgi:chromosome partitioning protein
MQAKPELVEMISHQERQNGCVIVVATQKGGVGKTTNCVHIAAALGLLGRKCLVWDLDSNQGATLHLGLDGDSLLGTFEILLGKAHPLKVVMTEEDANLPRNVHVIPSGHEVETVGRLKTEVEVSRLLEASLATLRQQYDYILLDTAPNLTVPTIAAYRAADWYILVTMPQPLAIVGLSFTLKSLRIAAKRGTVKGRLLGVLLCCVEPQRLLTRLGIRPVNFNRELANYIDERLKTRSGKSLRFQTAISSDAAIPQTQAEGKTLLQTRPQHPVAAQFRSLANEIEDRIRRDEDVAGILEETRET